MSNQNVGVFEMASGKTIIARYEDVSDEGITIGFTLTKPMLLQAVNRNGQLALHMSEWVGLYPICQVFAAGINGANLDNVPEQLERRYIEATTGIALLPERKAN